MGCKQGLSIVICLRGKDSFDDGKINKIAQRFGDDMELHSPKFEDVMFYNVWKAMALSKDPIKADNEYWVEKGLVNHDFAPEVRLNIIKKTFAKIMFFILKMVIK